MYVSISATVHQHIKPICCIEIGNVLQKIGGVKNAHDIRNGRMCRANYDAAGDDTTRQR